MENNQSDHATSKRKETLTTPIAIIIAGLIVAGAVYLRDSKTPLNTNDQFKVENTETVIEPISDKDHILGNPQADLIVVEYSDTECPFCKNFHQTMNRLISEYGKDGKVAWVYRHMPLEQLHQKAFKEAEATECAADVGGKPKFWEYINTIFEITTSNDGLDLAELPKIASKIGIDVNAFNKCMESGKYAQKIRESIEAGAKAGARGTPYSVILTKNGETYPVEGALPYNALKSVIDGLLKGE